MRTSYNKHFKKSELHFAVVALGWLGDTLLAENLCCNIKEKFPNAKVILIVSKKFEELGKIMSCDAYYAYDKDNKNKGISGIYWFAKDIKKEVKRIDFALITHPHERSIIFSKLLNAKKIVSMPLKGLTPINLLINRKQKRDMHALLSTYRGIYNAKLLEKIGITKLSLNTNITIPEEHISQTINKFGNVLQFSSDYIVLSTVGKRDWQDWDIQEVCSFVKKSRYKIVLIGTGKAHKIADEIKKLNLTNFIDLTNQTNILELAVIMKFAKLCISVDTGTMHLAYLLNKQTICLFYQPVMIPQWFPAHLDNVHLLAGVKVPKNDDFETYREIKHEEVLSIIEQIMNKK